MNGSVHRLADYRERRSVRRAGAYALVTVAVLYAFGAIADLRRTLDWSIRTAADLLPDDNADTEAA